MSIVGLTVEGVHGPYLVARISTQSAGPTGHLIALDPLGRATSGEDAFWTDSWDGPRHMIASISPDDIRVTDDGYVRARTRKPDGRALTPAEVDLMMLAPHKGNLQEAGLLAIGARSTRADPQHCILSSSDPALARWALRNGERLSFEADGGCALTDLIWDIGPAGTSVARLASRTPDDADVSAAGGLLAILAGARSINGALALRDAAIQIARAVNQGSDTVLAWSGLKCLQVVSPTLTASRLADLLPYADLASGLSSVDGGLHLLQLASCRPGKRGQPPLRLSLIPETRPGASLAQVGISESALAYEIATMADEDEAQHALKGVLALLKTKDQRRNVKAPA